MARPKRHVFVCVNRRPDGHPKGSCAGRGSIAVFQALQAARLGLEDQFRVSSSSCLGPCEQGASVVVHPDNVWYGGVTEDDVAELTEQHLLKGRTVRRLQMRE